MLLQIIAIELSVKLGTFFSKYGGNLGETGCVAWMFKPRGLLILERKTLNLSDDDLFLLALDNGGLKILVLMMKK